ncbi:MAG: ATPase, T2SS/T4P/T4SS family, partial [Phycisphaerae bacterium]
RLMVLGQLLTYRTDIPQEGRVSLPRTDVSTNASTKLAPLDLRLAIMPTTHGLRAALRLPADLLQPQRLEELGLPEPVLAGLRHFAAADSGLLILTGPAGSGKTTTIYALLSYIARQSSGLSIISLEDPVERHLPGVTQIEVTPHGELTYERALRSILRQDPQVLMLGEIRDAATASLAIQAALSGHRLICTLHASAAAGAVARLCEMGIEPYQITSAVWAVIAQRLLRRKTEGGGAGYWGRVPAAEIAYLDAAAREAILRRADAAELQALTARQSTYVSMRQVGADLAARGLTDAAEVLRVFGPE